MEFNPGSIINLALKYGITATTGHFQPRTMGKEMVRFCGKGTKSVSFYNPDKMNNLMSQDIPAGE